jgi:hypothetical protein
LDFHAPVIVCFNHPGRDPGIWGGLNMAILPKTLAPTALIRTAARCALGTACVAGWMALATAAQAQADVKNDPAPVPPPTFTDVKPGDLIPVEPAPQDPVVTAPAPPPETAPSTQPADTVIVSPAPDLAAGLMAALDSLGATFAPNETTAFAQTLATGLPDGVTGDTIGHLLYLRRHFDRGAWFFGQGALADPGDAAALSNFAALMAMTYQDAGPAAPDTWLPAAYAAARAADALSPDTAAILNNLGNLARMAGDLDTALAAGRRATEIAPDEPLYWTNLARSLNAAGDSDGAAAALARAHLLEPNGLALLETLPALPGARASYGQALQTQCNVNFRCQEICPRSIIGGLMSVTCEIENSSAQIACTEGRPYPTSYRCEEDLPEYGILIPGLNSGFSLAWPGFSVHVLVQGDGRVDVRVEGGISAGPLGGYLRADGHFSPSNGASFDNIGGGVRVNILPTSPANQLASDLGHPPIHIEAESLGGQPPQINLETYNAGLVSF